MVGDILRREREKQGLSILDVEQETSIRALYLEAIEKGQYDVLPGDVYTKGFIRNYAKMLNLDGAALAQEYNSERNIQVPQQPVDKMPAETRNDVAVSVRANTSHTTSFSNNVSTKIASSEEDFRQRVSDKSGSKKFLVLLGIMIVFLAGVYIAFSDESSDPNHKPVVKQTEEKQEQPAAKKYDGAEVVAKAKEDCWMSVSVDGKNVFEGILEKGKEMTWTGKEKVVITAGNAGGIELTWNGKSIGAMGPKGQVVERTLTKDSDGSKPGAAAATNDNNASDNTAAESSYNEGSEAAHGRQSAPARSEEPAPAVETPASPAAEAPAPAPAPKQEENKPAA